MKKENNWFKWILIALVIVIIYPLTYLCFKGDVGFPPGNGLEKSHWLGFLGDYLGFASSTFLAIVVFLQEHKINQLILAEYDPIVAFSILDFFRVETLEEVQYMRLDKTSSPLFLQFIFEPVMRHNITVQENKAMRFYLNISNAGKLSIKEFKIKRIVIDTLYGECVYERDIDRKYLEIKNIQPQNGCVDICICLKNFPVFKDDGIHKVRVDYTVANDKVHWPDKEYVFLITADETSLYDGREYRHKR